LLFAGPLLAQGANPRIGKWKLKKDMPVTGHPSADTTSVKRIDDRTINNTYRNYNEKGEVTTTTSAVYEKLP
jgi:hypothetical protein